jgi:hypothetical protein
MTPDPEFPPLASSATPQVSHGSGPSIRPENLVPSAIVDAFSQIPRLDKLALPQEYLALLDPVLQKLGIACREESIPKIEAGKRETFCFTLLTMEARPLRALLYVKDGILTAFNRGNRLALIEVRELFEGEYDTLYIFHRSPPKGAYKNLMVTDWQKRYRICAKFIALADLDDFNELTPEEQIAYLRRELDLDRTPAPPPEAPEKPSARDDLTLRDIRRLGQVLAALPAFAIARDRRVLLGTAGLNLLRFDLEGAPQAVADDVVIRLLEGGLGILLRAIKDLPEMPSANKDFITD